MDRTLALPQTATLAWTACQQERTSTSPHLTSPHLTSPHLTSPHLTSPHDTSSHIHLTSIQLTSPPPLLSSHQFTSHHPSSSYFTKPHPSPPDLTSPHLTSPPPPPPPPPPPHLTSSLAQLSSPHLTSPHLTLPHLTSPHLTAPHLTSTTPHLTSTHLTSHRPTSPYFAPAWPWCVLQANTRGTMAGSAPGAPPPSVTPSAKVTSHRRYSPPHVPSANVAVSLGHHRGATFSVTCRLGARIVGLVVWARPLRSGVVGDLHGGAPPWCYGSDARPALTEPGGTQATGGARDRVA